MTESRGEVMVAMPLRSRFSVIRTGSDDFYMRWEAAIHRRSRGAARMKDSSVVNCTSEYGQGAKPRVRRTALRDKRKRRSERLFRGIGARLPFDISHRSSATWNHT